MKDYKNVLEDFQDNCNDITWMARPIDFTKTYKKNRPKVSPSELKSLVSVNEQLHRDLLEILKQQTSKHSLNKKINDILNEIGYAYELPVIRWLGFFLIKMLKRSLSALYVNEEKLIKIKSDLGDCPVIFVPTHRSYGDFILMAFISFNYSINIPCVAAGMDFHSMRFMNEILRKSKAFYMRRKFSDDHMYRTIFKEYIKTLISNEDSPIEFFIEGTRSRSGKTLMPKFGLLTMLVDAYLSGNIPDIKVIPINISYDRVLEENLFAHELLGIPKPKESTKGLIKALKNLNGCYGNIFINFGDPFSIRTFFCGEYDLICRSNYYEATKIKEIAFKIINMQQSLQVFGCFNLLALVLYNTIISTHSFYIALVDAIEHFKWLLYVFKSFDAIICIAGNIENAIKESVAVHSSLVKISDDNCIHLKINRKQESSSENEHMEGLPFIMLQIYINPSINLFIRPSIAIAILKQMFKRNESSEDLLYKNYKYLCGLLKYEFAFNDINSMEFHDSLSKLKSLDIIEDEKRIIKLKQHTNKIDFFYYLIHPFLIGIYSVCLFLYEFQVEILQKPRTDIVKMAQSYIKKRMKDGLVSYYYCLSVDLISNSLYSLSNLGIICHKNVENTFIIETQPLLEAINYLKYHWVLQVLLERQMYYSCESDVLGDTNKWNKALLLNKVPKICQTVPIAALVISHLK